MEDLKGNMPLPLVIGDRTKKLADAAVKAEKEANALKVLAQHWPEDHPITGVYYSGSFRELGDIHVSVTVDSRADALEYLNAFELKPITFLSGGGISTIRVVDWTDPKKIERYETEISDIYPVYWRFSYHNKPIMTAHTEFDGLRVNIKITIKKDPATRSVKFFADTKDIASWELTNVPEGGATKYAGSSDHPGEVLVYLFKEPGGGAPDMLDLLTTPERQQTVKWGSR